MEIDFEAKSVFFDTAPYIYLLDYSDMFRDSARCIFEHCLENCIRMSTSVITIEEFSVKPLRDGDVKLADDLRRFLEDTGTFVASVDGATAYEAAKIRARFSRFKGMDSLQLASARLLGCDLFVTNDKQLKQYDEISVLTISELSK